MSLLIRLSNNQIYRIPDFTDINNNIGQENKDQLLNFIIDIIDIFFLKFLQADGIK